MRVRNLLLGFAAAASLAGAAHASANLVTNGDFESTAFNESAQIGTWSNHQQVTDWTTNGYTFVFRNGHTSGVGVYGAMPLATTGNGFTASPTGGNYIVSDGAYAQDSIRQEIYGLTAGKTYTLSFWWAAAQQLGYSGAQDHTWTASLGNESYTTAILHNTQQGFQPWRQQTFTFTATDTHELLSFLAHGEPAGTPPFTLLDGVSLTAGGVPEPAAWALMIVGFGAVGASLRQRRRVATAA